MNDNSIPIVVELRKSQPSAASLSIYNITIDEIFPLLDQRLQIKEVSILCVDRTGKLMEVDLGITIDVKQLREVLDRNGYKNVSIQIKLEKGIYIDADFGHEIHIYSTRITLLVNLVQQLLSKWNISYRVSRLSAFCFAIQKGEVVHFGSMNEYLNNNEKYVPKTSVRRKAS